MSVKAKPYYYFGSHSAGNRTVVAEGAGKTAAEKQIVLAYFVAEWVLNQM